MLSETIQDFENGLLQNDRPSLAGNKTGPKHPREYCTHTINFDF